MRLLRSVYTVIFVLNFDSNIRGNCYLAVFFDLCGDVGVFCELTSRTDAYFSASGEHL